MLLGLDSNIPVECFSSSAQLFCVVCIQKISADSKRRQLRQVKILIYSKCLDDAYLADLFDIFGRLRAVELNGSQANRMSNAPDAFGAELVNKDTHKRDERRQGLDDRFGFRGLNVTRATFVKVKAQRVGAQVDCLLRILQIRYAANLDSNHVQYHLRRRVGGCPLPSSGSESLVLSKHDQASRTS